MSEPLFKPASKKQAMFLQSNATVIVYGGSAGSGKAQPLYSKVLTVDGWKTMGDIEVGDYIISPDNKPVEVLKTFHHDSKNIYEITTQSGRVTRACDEHLWDVYISSKNKKSQREVVTTTDLISLMGEGRKVRLPLCDKIGSNEDVDLPITPYVLGVIIAEGGLTSHNVTFTNTDAQLLDRFRTEIGGKYQLKETSDCITYRITPVVRERRVNHNNSNVWSNSFKNHLDDLGLMGTNCYSKFIPKQYLNSSINQRLDLLKGLMDSDGSINDSLTCEYSTSSEQLALDVKELVQSLGGVARITSRIPSYTYKGEKKQGATSYRVYIRMQDCKDLFYITRKSDRARKRKVLVTDEIVSIRFVGEEPAKCISVDSEDHLYITDDYIVTHNTFQSLLRFLRWVDDPKFVGYVIRKESTSLKGGGGAFDEAQNIYPMYDKTCKVTTQPMRFRFKSGASIDFLGLDGDRGKKKIQGKEISAAFVDEATHLTEDEIEWIISRLRTKAKMSPSIWLTCNPDPDSFIYRMIKDYYLYPEGTIINGELVEGRPIPERNGVVRYYLKMGNDRVWGDTEQELIDQYSHFFAKEPDGTTSCKPISFQFIGATCYDNPPLLEADPMYLSKLQSLNRVDKERLLYGCWTAREEDAGYFKRKWTPVVKSLPKDVDIVKRVRCFDLASSVPSEAYPNPDWTVGVLMCKTRSGEYYIEHVERFRMRAGEVENAIIEIVRKDREHYGSCYKAYLPQDPASAGQIARKYWSKLFAEKGIPIYFNKVGSKNGKLKRAEPFFASAENSLVYVVEGEWNSCFFDELESFDDKRSSTKKDDQVDANSDCFNLLATTKELPKLNARLLVMS